MTDQIGIRRSILASACAAILVASPGHPVLAQGSGAIDGGRSKKIVLQSWTFSCGAAALATLLTYQLGDAVDERQVMEGMLTRTSLATVKAHVGFSLLDLKYFAQSRGFSARGLGQLGLADLAALGPSIVPLRAGAYDHFVVFRGLSADRVLLADPAAGTRIIDAATFERLWTSHVAFVVARTDRKITPDSLTATPEDFRQSAPSTTSPAR